MAVGLDSPRVVMMGTWWVAQMDYLMVASMAYYLAVMKDSSMVARTAGNLDRSWVGNSEVRLAVHSDSLTAERKDSQMVAWKATTKAVLKELQRVGCLDSLWAGCSELLMAAQKVSH